MKVRDGRLFALVFVALFAVLSFAADIFSVSAEPGPQPQAGCPQAQVVCPDSVEKTGKLAFTATIKGGDQNVTPTFNWTVSQGSIGSGQGTSVIELDMTGIVEGTSVTATVDIGGFSRECGYGSTSASCTTSIIKKAEARKFDEYGGIKPVDQEPRLDNFAIELQNDPTAVGYIISYGGRASRPGDPQKAGDRAKNYIVKKRGIDPARVMAVDGGYREEPSFELWLVPVGADGPTATPTMDPPTKKPAAKTKKRKGKKS